MVCDQLQQEIQSPALKTIVAHWDQMRGINPMPTWAQLKPASMARQLGIIWAYKYDPRNGKFTGRLAGNRITEGYGKNFRGARLEDLHPPAALPRIYRHMRHVVEAPAIYKSSGTLFRKDGVRGVGERIMLPLGNGIVDGVIGASDYELAPDTDVHDGIELVCDNLAWYPVR